MAREVPLELVAASVFTATASGTCTTILTTADMNNESCKNSSIVDYRLLVTLDGSDTMLTPAGDNVAP